MNDRELNEAMDACRPQSNDLQLPELQPLAEALERDSQLPHVFQQRQLLDQRLAEGLRRVDLSANRRARLLAAARPAVTEEPSIPDVVPAPAPAAKVPPEQRRRRFLTVAAIGLTALSLLLLATLTYHWFMPWRTISPQQLARWTMQDWAPQPRGWRPMNELSRAKRQSISRYLRVHPARWQPLVTHLDDEALIFDLPGNRKATRLYVLDAGRRARRLPTGPPQQPQTSYEGQLFAAWQEMNHVYVLSVAGSTQHYRDVVYTPGHSLARSARNGLLAE